MWEITVLEQSKYSSRTKTFICLNFGDFLKLHFYILRLSLKFLLFSSFIIAFTPALKVGINVNLSEILRGLKKGKKKENYFRNTTRQLTPTHEHPRLSGDCLGVHLLIFNLRILILKSH